MFQWAFGALHDPASRSCYDKWRTRGKIHPQALLRLARRRINVLFARLRNAARGDFHSVAWPSSHGHGRASPGD